MTSSRPDASDAPHNAFIAEADAPRPPTPSRRARQLLQLAHQAVYRLPSTYPGFTAAVEARSDRWTVRGTVGVHCPHGAVFDLDPDDPGHDHAGNGSSASPDAPTGSTAQPSAATVTLVTTMILDLVSWQFPKRFDDLDGRYEAGFRPDLDQDGRRAIQLLGESRRTIRWLDERGVAATAYRRAGVAHHIAVAERKVLADERWLPVRVNTFQQREGVADLHHSHADTFTDVEGIQLPLRRLASVTAVGDGEVPATASVGAVTIELRDHRNHRSPATA